MIHRLLSLIIVSFIVTSCVPSNNFSSDGSGTSSGTATEGATGIVSASSCGELSAYTSLTTCKQATFAQCYPSTKIINNQTSVCYFPVTGWEQCASNQAQWSYGSWGNYCKETAGIYRRTRTATCQRNIAACDCNTDSITEDRCAYGISGSSYPTCSVTSVFLSAIACGSIPTPTPTPVPTPSWCSTSVLNYQTTDSSSEGFLRDVINNKYPTIINYFSSRGYQIAYTRGSTYSLAVSGPITDDLISNHYVIQIEGHKWGCVIGSNGRVRITLKKNGTTLSTYEGAAGCISTSLSANATQDALNNLNAPICQ